jgi:hypothetical protein
MPSIGFSQDEFWQELDKLGPDEVRVRIKTGIYSNVNTKRGLAEEWLLRKEQAIQRDKDERSEATALRHLSAAEEAAEASREQASAARGQAAAALEQATAAASQARTAKIALVIAIAALTISLASPIKDAVTYLSSISSVSQRR